MHEKLIGIKCSIGRTPFTINFRSDSKCINAFVDVIDILLLEKLVSYTNVDWQLNLSYMIFDDYNNKDYQISNLILK